MTAKERARRMPPSPMRRKCKAHHALRAFRDVALDPWSLPVVSTRLVISPTNAPAFPAEPRGHPDSHPVARI